jgi:hypothetical protein
MSNPKRNQDLNRPGNGGQFASEGPREEPPNVVLSEPNDVRQLTEDEFDEEFGGTLDSPDGETVWDEVPPQGEWADNQIWTVIEEDGSRDQYLIPGVHRVNRVGYVVSVEPWQDENIEVHWVDANDYDDDPSEPMPAGAGRVTLDWDHVAAEGVYEATSTSGWGSKATIVTPDAGDGENFYWEVKQGGWTWEGRVSTLDEAKAAAQSEANRMLDQQEVEPGGFDWEAEDDDEFGDWV